MQVELAEPTPVHHVVIHWETAAAAHYQLQVSSDGQTWQTALDVPDAPGGREVHELDWETPVRFVRMQGVANQYPGWGYSIWSLEIWNGPRPGVGLPAGEVIPAPVEQSEVDAEPFELTKHTQTIARTEPARKVARRLRAELRPATGYPLPIVSARARSGDIELVLAPGRRRRTNGSRSRKGTHSLSGQIGFGSARRQRTVCSTLCRQFGNCCLRGPTATLCGVVPGRSSPP